MDSGDVIRGLKCCTMPNFEGCSVCPYRTTGSGAGLCDLRKLLREALKLLEYYAERVDDDLK